MGEFNNFFGDYFIDWFLVIQLEGRAYHFVCNAHDPCGFWIVLESMEIGRDWHDFAPCLQAGARLVSQPPAPGSVPLAVMELMIRLMRPPIRAVRRHNRCGVRQGIGRKTKTPAPR